jgi:hypothetical protein
MWQIMSTFAERKTIGYMLVKISQKKCPHAVATVMRTFHKKRVYLEEFDYICNKNKE